MQCIIGLPVFIFLKKVNFNYYSNDLNTCAVKKL